MFYFYELKEMFILLLYKWLTADCKVLLFGMTDGSILKLKTIAGFF